MPEELRFQAWLNLYISFLSEANQNTTKTVIDAVVEDNGGTDKCPWSTAEMKGNCT